MIGDRTVALRQQAPLRLPVIVVVVGLIVTGVLALVSQSLYSRNEQRLLDLRARDVGSVLSAAIPSLQTTLASAAELADATDGNAQKFDRFIAPYVGAPPQHQFITASLWRAGASAPKPITTVGVPLMLGASTRAASAFLSRATRTPGLDVVGLLQTRNQRLGYGFANPGPARRFLVYAESSLPASRRSRAAGNSAFSDLDYAVYLGRSPQPGELLVTSLSQLPVRGNHATATVPFGNTALTIVISPRRALAGTLPQRLPWLIGIVGFLLSLGAGTLTWRLIQRRRAAERLAMRLERAAGENRRLYAEQRDIAQTLQHALLPSVLPELVGAEASARFQPGERGVEIGGDWYDVIELDRRRVMVVVGDVSGRGLGAASTMASLRFAIHAYAAQDDPPETILTKLSRLVSVSAEGRLATVLCSVVDIDTREVTVTSAGHLPPLMIGTGGSEYVRSEVGLPVGVDDDASYTSTTVTAPPAATILLYTDGLVERRGESLDDGLARLQRAAGADHAGLPELLSRLLTDLRHEPSEDDTAIVGVRWMN
jgi:serine phosphatase RsbU (regulator of sigma subunit)